MELLNYEGDDTEFASLVENANNLVQTFKKAVDNHEIALTSAIFYITAVTEVNSVYLQIEKEGEGKQWVETNRVNFLTLYRTLKEKRNKINESEIPSKLKDGLYATQKAYHDVMIKQLELITMTQPIAIVPQPAPSPAPPPPKSGCVGRIKDFFAKCCS